MFVFFLALFQRLPFHVGQAYLKKKRRKKKKKKKKATAPVADEKER